MRVDDRTIRTLRAQAWERAVGNLRSMEHTFFTSDEDSGQLDGKWNRFDRLLTEFIKEVESHELHC